MEDLFNHGFLEKAEETEEEATGKYRLRKEEKGWSWKSYKKI